MKKSIILPILCTLFFAACSSSESDLELNTLDNDSNYLQSYTLLRDIDGRYSLDINVKENTQVDNFTQPNSVNELVFSKVDYTTDKNISNDYTIENDYLKINFLESSKGQKSFIQVKDDNIQYANKNGVTKFLKKYSVTKNEDGTFTLNFHVNKNVTTNFVYNEAIETYEVHLAEGKSKTRKFTKELEVPESKILRVDFVNYIYGGGLNRGQSKYSLPRKPEVIIDTGQDLY